MRGSRMPCYQEGCFNPALVTVNKTIVWNPDEVSEV